MAVVEGLAGSARPSAEPVRDQTPLDVSIRAVEQSLWASHSIANMILDELQPAESGEGVSTLKERRIGLLERGFNLTESAGGLEAKLQRIHLLLTEQGDGMIKGR